MNLTNLMKNNPTQSWPSFSGTNTLYVIKVDGHVYYGFGKGSKTEKNKFLKGAGELKNHGNKNSFLYISVPANGNYMNSGGYIANSSADIIMVDFCITDSGVYTANLKLQSKGQKKVDGGYSDAFDKNGSPSKKIVRISSNGDINENAKSELTKNLQKLFYHWSENNSGHDAFIRSEAIFWNEAGWTKDGKICTSGDFKKNSDGKTAQFTTTGATFKCQRTDENSRQYVAINASSGGEGDTDDDNNPDDTDYNPNNTDNLLDNNIQTQTNGMPSADVTADTSYITDMDNFKVMFVPCIDSRTGTEKTFSAPGESNTFYKNKMLNFNSTQKEKDKINHLLLCVEKDQSNISGTVTDQHIDDFGLAKTNDITDTDAEELYTVLDQLQTQDQVLNHYGNIAGDIDNNDPHTRFYYNNGIQTTTEKGGIAQAMLGPFRMSTTMALKTEAWITNRTPAMFAVIIDRTLSDQIDEGTALLDPNGGNSESNKATWKRIVIDPTKTEGRDSQKVRDGFAEILYWYSSKGAHKDDKNYKPKILLWSEYNILTPEEKRQYKIKYFDVIIDPNKALISKINGTQENIVTIDTAAFNNTGSSFLQTVPVILENNTKKSVLCYDIVENTNTSFMSYIEANKDVIRTLFRKEFNVEMGLNDNKNTMKVVAVKLFEAYTRGRDFIEEPYVEVRADEQKPKDETSIITLQRQANRWMSYNDNYFTYKYTGRDFNLRKPDGARYLLSQDIKDENGKSIYTDGQTIESLECALVHSKDLLQEDDVTLGDTYEVQKYYIQALKYLDSNNDQLYHYKDTFKLTDYVDAVNTVQNKENEKNKKEETSYLSINKKHDNKYIEDDLDVITSYIDMTKCPFYNAEKATYENHWCDCCYADGGDANTLRKNDSNFNKECFYEKYGICPYRFITEKHPRRIRTLKQDRSNRFNLIQELCKEFEFYPQFYIEYDDSTGKVKTYKEDDKEVIEGKHKKGQMRKHVYFMKERGQDKYAGFRYEKNLSSITRTVDSNSLTTKLYVEDNDSELAQKGVCSIQLAQDNIPKTSYIINFDYYIMKNLLNRAQVQKDLWGVSQNDRAFLSQLGKLNTTYDNYSDLITTLTSKEMIDLLAEIKVAVEGIGTGIEERKTISQTMYQYKHSYSETISKYSYTTNSTSDEDNSDSSGKSGTGYHTSGNLFYNKAGEAKAKTSSTTSVTTTDTYRSYLTKYREQATIIWGLVEQLFYSGDYFSIPFKADGIDNNLYQFITYSYSNDSFNEAQDKRLQSKYLSAGSYYIEDKYYRKDTKKDGDTRRPWNELKFYLGYDESDNTKPLIKYSDIIKNGREKYCKGELFWRLVIEGFDFDEDSFIQGDMDYKVAEDKDLKAIAYKNSVSCHIPFTSWEDFKTTIIQQLLYPSTGQLGQYRSLYNQVKHWKLERQKILNRINEISEHFYQVYEPFIKEGTYSDSNFLDSNKYYWAAVDVLNDSCKPEVSYSLDVVDISPIKEYTDDYTFEIGDITYVEDIDFFDINQTTGLPNRQKVLLSEMTYNLDDPTKNSITLQNYSSSFDDLFEQITATVQSLTYNENTYKRASNITSQQYISSASLQGALSEGGLTLLDAHDGNIVTTDDGTEGAGINNTNVKYKLDGQGLYFSTDGGETWDVGVGPKGINADYIKMGQLDASKIQIVDGDYIYFLWDKNGINAYRSPSKSTDGLKDFARFNKYGLSLIEKGKVRLRAGYDFKTKKRLSGHSNYNGTGDYTNEVELKDQNVGFFLYNDKGQSIFRTETASSFKNQTNSSDYTARLSLDGEMFVTNTVLPGDAANGSLVAANAAKAVKEAYDIVEGYPIELLTKIDGSDEELKTRFTKETGVQSKKSSHQYYKIAGGEDPNKLYKYGTKESLTTEDGSAFCVHIIGENGGYYYINTSSVNILMGIDSQEYAIVEQDYSPSQVSCYEYDKLEGEEGQKGGVDPITCTLYNVPASGNTAQREYSYWGKLTNDNIIALNGRTDGGYMQTDQVGIFINNKIPSTQGFTSNNDEEDTDEETKKTDDNSNTQEEVNNGNTDEKTSGPRLGEGNNVFDDTDFIIIGDSICEGLRNSKATYHDKFTGQGSMGVLTPEVKDATSTTGIIDNLSSYNKFGFMFGTNGSNATYSSLSNDNYANCIKRIFNKKRPNTDYSKITIYIITPPCKEYMTNTPTIGDQHCSKETMMNGTTTAEVAKLLGCQAGKDIDIWEASKNYGYGSSNTDDVHAGCNATNCEGFSNLIRSSFGGTSASNTTTSDNNDNLSVGINPSVDPGKMKEWIRKAQQGTERVFSIAFVGKDTSTGEIGVNNILSVLKSGILYMGGTITEKYGSKLNINDLTYLPDEIKINNPRFVMNTEGVIWCNWDKFFRIIEDENGHSQYDGSGQSLMAYLTLGIQSGGGSGATSSTGGVSGYFLIDPLSAQS